MADLSISYYRDFSHLLKYVDAALDSHHLVFALFVGEDGTIFAEQIKRPGGGRASHQPKILVLRLMRFDKSWGFFKV
ncbi:MAG: hypothetical protein MI864_14010 [Pseudomonadales bacterium]|nr:hypothetical protein [Pseudomonadales bacterium]